MIEFAKRLAATMAACAAMIVLLLSSIPSLAADPVAGVDLKLAACSVPGCPSVRTAAGSEAVFANVPAGPNTLTIDGQSLSAAIAKYLPRDRKGDGPSVGIGIGGLFGGGSGHGDPKGHGSRTSSGGGVGLGISIGGDSHKESKPLYLDITLTGPGGRRMTLERTIDPASPSDLRIDFDLPVPGTLNVKLEVVTDKLDSSDPRLATNTWTAGNDAAPNPGPVTKPSQATVPPGVPVKRNFRIGPDLALVETVSGTMTVGQTVTFTYQVFNVGTTPVISADVTTRLPSNVSATDYTVPFVDWGCGGYPFGPLGSFSCSYNYPAPSPSLAIPPGGAFPTWKITGKLVRTGTFNICSVVSIPGGVIDVNHINDQSCVGGTVQPMPKSDLSVIKTGPGIATPGLGANFTIVVHNNGPSPVGAQSGITVTDSLPANALTWPVIANGPGWTCTHIALNVSCSYAGAAVASGADLPTITVRPKAGTTGSFFNCATVGMTAGDDTNIGNNKGCVDFEVRLPQAGSSSQ